MGAIDHSRRTHARVRADGPAAQKVCRRRPFSQHDLCTTAQTHRHKRTPHGNKKAQRRSKALVRCMGASKAGFVSGMGQFWGESRRVFTGLSLDNGSQLQQKEKRRERNGFGFGCIE